MSIYWTYGELAELVRANQLAKLALARPEQWLVKQSDSYFDTATEALRWHGYDDRCISLENRL